MARLPTVRDVLIDTSSPQSLFNHNLGIAVLNDALLNPRGTFAGPIKSGYIRPWRHMPGQKSGISSVQLDKDGFMVSLDVQQFEPGEVVVRAKEGQVTVEGDHRERQDDHGLVSRRFKRRYALPDDVEHEAITSNLSANGVLTIRAPKRKRALGELEKARVIPIVHTQVPALKQSTSSSIAQSMES